MGSALANIDQAAAVQWIKKLHATIDTLDAELWLDTVATSDITMKFYSNPEFKGREQVGALLSSFFASLTALKHETQHTDWAAPRIYNQARAYYHIKRVDGVEDVVAMDLLGVYYMREDDDGVLKSYRMEIYGDPNELNQKLMAAG